MVVFEDRWYFLCWYFLRCQKHFLDESPHVGYSRCYHTGVSVDTLVFRFAIQGRSFGVLFHLKVNLIFWVSIEAALIF